MSRKILHEAGTLSPAKADGTYRVCLITEGKGSSADYPRELFTQENADAFSDALSFMNHPLDPNRPHLRPAEDIIGQVGSKIDVEEHDGLMGFWADYKPRKSDPQKAAFVEEYAHALGLSIYIMANGRIEMVKETESEYGVETFITESFDGTDPYKSVDIVVAAGRGGHFARAQEAYRRFESSAVKPADNKPDATSAQEQEEGQMDKEILEALVGLKTAVDALATSSKTTAEAEAQAKADAAAVDAGVEERVTKYEAAIDEIEAEAEHLLESQVKNLRAQAREGVDVKPLIESAKAITAEARAAFGNQDDDTFTGGRIVESAGATTRTAESVIPGGWA